MARKRYPIGIQTFERIRKEDWFYVDKTEYIYRMTHTDGTYFFLSRPRRFGKSLLVSTFESYFEGKRNYSMVLPSKSWKKNGMNILCSTSVWLEASTWEKSSWSTIFSSY